ncbi:MAG: M23 family metallopeptidase [Clostridia bacterium]|nr:M23 family metallopeptidase [Clostridia bacterium]
MENKVKRKSINSVIYLLLAGMLLCVIFVSVYTVASRRNKPTPVEGDDTSAVTSDTTGSGTSTTKPVDTSASGTTAPADTTARSAESTAPASVTKSPDEVPVAINDGEELPTSIDIRYFVMPVAGTMGKAFEIDIPVWSQTMNDYRAHTGVDIAAPLGSEVVSSSSGVVCKIWNDPMMGRCVTIDHGDDIYTTYMNLAPDLAQTMAVGAKVSMGQVIGAVGESSLVEIAEEPHLHMEMKVSGSYVNPLDYFELSSSDNAVYED